MTITRALAMQLWQSEYGDAEYAEDFDGGLMRRNAYGDPNYYEWQGGRKVYCGWNIHHILPIARGGKSRRDNMICTNIITNEQAGDKVTYWLDNGLYQVQKKRGTSIHFIVKLEDTENE